MVISLVSDYAVRVYTVGINSWENPHIGSPICEELLW